MTTVTATPLSPHLERALQAALALHQAGSVAEARRHYATVLAEVPGHALTLEYDGVAALQMQDFAAAYAALSAAHHQQPDDLELLGNLALAAARSGRLIEARAALTRVASATSAVGAWVNLGNVCEQMGDRKGAIEALREALRRSPDHLEALTNLGRVLTAERHLDDAIATLERAVALNPRHATAALNLGHALKDTGDMTAASARYDDAIRVRPDYLPAHSAALLAACYRPVSADVWQRRLADLARALPPAGPAQRATRLADGRVHVALVSADFRTHAAVGFVLSLLEAVDRSRFKVSLYSNHSAKDAMSEALASHADAWVDAIGMNDAALTGHMRAAGVAVALDLSGHSAGNRLPAFAARLAPVQATWLGFLGSTGVAAMDYRLTDVTADPPNAVPWHTEHLVRMPTAWCYHPRGATPEFDASTDRAVTFGCLNNPAKLSDATLATWGALLAAHPHARLVLHAHEHTRFRQRLQDALVSSGAQASQIEFQGFVSQAHYWQTLARVDVALDPWPYSGGTTTCDALYAGVPVVAMAAAVPQPFSSSTASCLAAIDRSAWVAPTRGDFLQIAGALAANGPRDGAARRALHAHVQVSALMDQERFARHFETALQTMFDAHA